MNHEDKVRAIAGQVRARSGARGEAHIAKGGVPHVVPLPGDTRRRGRPVDIRALDEVLSIEGDRCVVESGVSFERLVPLTLARGLLPAVVPELKGITVGGAIAGCSVESMSYRVGGLHDTCREYEVVTGDGRVLTCSRERDPLLFDMLHGSYGTLGVLTKVTLDLVPARPYVRVEYRRFRTFGELQAELVERCRAADFDFVDAIVHAPDELVACLGRFVDAAPWTSDYSRLDVYYRSARTRAEDYLTTFDYCFRYDADCHWVTRGFPLLERRLVRRLLGKRLLGSTNLLRWAKRLEGVKSMFKRRPDVVVDVFIPRRRLEEFYAWYARELAFYPLWIVPYRMARPYPWLAPGFAARLADDLHFDLAVYGMPNDHPDLDLSEVLEARVREHDGVKTLISRTHYAPEVFWSIYDRDAYQQAKRQLDPTGTFPGLYEKLHPQGGARAARRRAA